MTVPGVIEKEFPGARPVAGTDFMIISRQIRRKPTGEIYVVRRCPREKPAVILTVPGGRERKKDPPLLWLSCPSAAKAMGGLESTGLMKDFSDRLGMDDEARSLFRSSENEFSRTLEAVASSCPGGVFAERLKGRGVAGGRKGGVKCLHAHMAWYLTGRQGLLGEWCIKELEKRGGGVWCEKVPQACID